MIYQEFYSELGKLLYAIADIDGVISKEEKEEMRERLKKDIIPTEKHADSFGTNVANYAEIEFEYLDYEISDPNVAFESFINYVQEHKTAMDDHLKSYCLYLADRVANAYHGTNKKEQKLLDKLRETLSSI